mmetsp:Transcript_24615/g.38246  ORF Transcript_24615/g.38246 Transcript_24615/m.38246 type:complete len:85 (+) Transcript_24615:1302-1556(+)
MDAPAPKPSKRFVPEKDFDLEGRPPKTTLEKLQVVDWNEKRHQAEALEDLSDFRAEAYAALPPSKGLKHLLKGPRSYKALNEKI